MVVEPIVKESSYPCFTVVFFSIRKEGNDEKDWH